MERSFLLLKAMEHCPHLPFSLWTEMTGRLWVTSPPRNSLCLPRVPAFVLILWGFSIFEDVCYLFSTFAFFFFLRFFFFNVDHFLKAFIEFLTTLLLFCFGFCLWGMWDLSCPTRDQTHTLCIGGQSLNHWTTREVSYFLLIIFYFI